MTKVLALALLIFAPVPAALIQSAAPSLPTNSSQQEKNKAIARRVFDEIFNQGKFQVANESTRRISKTTDFTGRWT